MSVAWWERAWDCCQCARMSIRSHAADRQTGGRAEMGRENERGGLEWGVPSAPLCPCLSPALRPPPPWPSAAPSSLPAPAHHASPAPCRLQICRGRDSCRSNHLPLPPWRGSGTTIGTTSRSTHRRSDASRPPASLLRGTQHPFRRWRRTPVRSMSAATTAHPGCPPWGVGPLQHCCRSKPIPLTLMATRGAGAAASCFAYW